MGFRLEGRHLSLVAHDGFEGVNGMRFFLIPPPCGEGGTS
jgi:hypothetical protein